MSKKVTLLSYFSPKSSPAVSEKKIIEEINTNKGNENTKKLFSSTAHKRKLTERNDNSFSNTDKFENNSTLISNSLNVSGLLENYQLSDINSENNIESEESFLKIVDQLEEKSIIEFNQEKYFEKSNDKCNISIEKQCNINFKEISNVNINDISNKNIIEISNTNISKEISNKNINKKSNTKIKNISNEKVKEISNEKVNDKENGLNISKSNVKSNEKSNINSNSSKKSISKSKNKSISTNKGNIYEDRENSIEDIKENIKDSFKNKIEELSIFYSQDISDEKANKIDEISTSEYPHNKYQFLTDEYRRDKDGRRPTDPNYDPTTLQLPVAFLSSKEITPAMKQWWKIKAANFDTVLFFKMGKFYELFHMDADIGVKELGLTYMKGRYAHAGFPETSFSIHASALVEKGYKVGRVEQTEKPEDVTVRIKETGASSASDKLVRRDLCNVMSASTRIFDSFDIEVDVNAKNSLSNTGFGLLLAIVEEQKTISNQALRRFGVCVLDSSIASFTFAEFEDDRSFSKLRTMLAHFSIPVAEIFVVKNSISPETFSKVKKVIDSARVEVINKQIQAENVVKEFLSCDYFSDNNPKVLDDMIDGKVEESGLSLVAFGAVIYILKRHLIDHQVISAGNFNIYTPDDVCRSVGNISDNGGVNSKTIQGVEIKNMIIDDNALRNLDVVVNSEGYIGRYGTVLSLVNHCMTAAGKRKIVSLVCHPLYQRNDIIARLDSIQELISLNRSQFNSIRQSMGEIPDLERILFRLNSCKQLHENSDHPQNSAILFNEKYFNAKKVDDMVSIINGFETALTIFLQLKGCGFSSSLLKDLLDSNNSDELNEGFESIMAFFKEFKSSFDLQKAKSTSVIIPQIGAIPEYDKNLEEIFRIEEKFKAYLESLKKEFGNNIKFWGTDKSRYQIEIPASVTKIPKNFELKSQRKGFKRYSSPFCTNLLTELIEAETSKQSILKNVYVLLIKKLLLHYPSLKWFIQKFTMIDCLFAFAYFSSGAVTNGPLCRPVISDSQNQFLKVKDSYHPCLSTVKQNVVSNDINIGSIFDDKTTLLITGPNMGGKSTFMRQTAILVILAQLGCYVPASHCELTPFDRIFARLGASFDHPNCGESTFYVELAETSVMVQRASSRSLILLDELGRGTATHDGLAIAYSILKYVSFKVRCITLFSTHYHYIARDLSMMKTSPISMVFMECLINDEANDSENKNPITFLYKLKNGICPKSYGFYVARLAGMQENIVLKGIEMARKMERFSLFNELTQSLRSQKDIDYISLCKKLVKLKT